MKITELEMESEIVHFVDEIKELISLEAWDKIMLDCSKNEILVLWLIYRQTEVNMTQVAEYIQVPLNTVTGIVSRLEKRKLLIRQRDEQDKRVVTIRLTDQGVQLIKSLMKEFSYYAVQFAAEFSPEEIEHFFKMLDKVKCIMGQQRNKKVENNNIRKITID